MEATLTDLLKRGSRSSRETSGRPRAGVSSGGAAPAGPRIAQMSMMISTMSSVRKNCPRLQRIAALIHIVLGESFRSEDDLLLERLLVQDLQGGLDGFRTAGRILEGRGQDSVLDVFDAFGRQSIDADELDGLFAALALLLSGFVGAMRAGVVMSVHGVNFGEAGERGVH